MWKVGQEKGVKETLDKTQYTEKQDIRDFVKK